MKTIKYIIISLFILTLVTNCSNEDGMDEPEFVLKNPDYLDDMDYEIYSLILQEKFSNTNYLVINQEISKKSSMNIEIEKFQYLETEILDFDALVFSDFIIKNDTIYNLDNKFNITSKEITLISSDEIDYLQDKNWDEFYKKYPNTNGLIGMSRIGFNLDKNQAIVEIELVSGFNLVQGSLLFLKKENDEWKIISTIYIWTS